MARDLLPYSYGWDLGQIPTLWASQSLLRAYTSPKEMLDARQTPRPSTNRGTTDERPRLLLRGGGPNAVLYGAQVPRCAVIWDLVCRVARDGTPHC